MVCFVCIIMHSDALLQGPQGPKEVIEKALAANRRLQARLTDILAAVDRAIWRNAETQAKLMHHAEAWPRAGRYKGMRGDFTRPPPNTPAVLTACQTLYRRSTSCAKTPSGPQIHKSASDTLMVEPAPWS